MRTVVFVAPYLLEATVRFVRAAAALDGVRLVLLSQDRADKLPGAVRARLTGHLVLRDALDPGEIAEAVRDVSKAIAPVERVFGSLEQLQVPLAQVREALDVPGLRPEAAANFRDKSRMKEVLRAAGVPCARHRLVGRISEAASAAEHVGFPLVAKPPAGAGAKDTHRVDSPEALAALLARLPPDPERPTLLEEFVVGEEHSFDAVAIDGRPVWHSLSHYAPSALTVIENPWIQWTVLIPREVDDPKYDDIRAVGAKALAALGMRTGLAHMEWFRRGDGSVAISEVGARPPGAQFTTLISYAHEIDLYHAWARLMVFDRFDPPLRAYAAGAAYLRGQGTGRVRAIHGLAQAQRELGRLVVEARLPPVGSPPTGSYEGEGYVILRHPRTEVVRDALRRLVSLVHVEMG